MATRPEMVSLSDCDLGSRPYTSLTQRAPSVSLHFLAHLNDYILLLPPPEQDVIALYVSQGVRQVAIALLMGVSQQTISRRLKRAHQRLLFHLQQPSVDAGQMRADLEQLLPRQRMVDVLCDIAQTASYLVSAGRLGAIFQEVHAAGKEALSLLAADPRMDALFYLHYFERLLESRNIFGARVKTYVEPTRRAADLAAGAPRFGERPWSGGGQDAARRVSVPVAAVHRCPARSEAAGATL